MHLISGKQIFTMSHSRKIIFLLVFCFVTLSGISQTKTKSSTNFFNHDNFYKDTLYIKTRFTECGEWGGHLELSRIFLKGHQFYIIYQNYSSDCSSIKENNGEPIQTLIKTKSKRLNENDEQLIRQYLHQTLDAKLKEQFPGQVGYIFKVYNTDNSINLSVYTWGAKIKDQYIQLIKKLFP